MIFNFFLSNIISASIGAKITLFLTDRKEKREASVRFTNRLKSLSFELKINFRHVGNKDNPFVTKALENLVYNEPLVHHHPELFEKAQNCLNIALLCSGCKGSCEYPPSRGQKLMIELSEYLSSQFNVITPDFK